MSDINYLTYVGLGIITVRAPNTLSLFLNKESRCKIYLEGDYLHYFVLPYNIYFHLLRGYPGAKLFGQHPLFRPLNTHSQAAFLM
jgi:hypothetical protein